jgi:predicted Zn-dependent protease
MNAKIWKDLLILIIIGAGLFTAGYVMIRRLDVGRLDLNTTLSIENEEKLGELFKDLITKQYHTSQDNAADTALQAVTGRLLQALDSTKYIYHFSIIKSEEINAFTIPGGNIYVFSGLIKFCKTPEELAAVLSHEIGHAEKRHVVQKLAKELSMATVVTILSGGDPSIVTKILQEIIGNSFGREQEEEADDFAINLMEKAHVDPINLAVFFKRLNDQDLGYNKNLELIMTHPHNDKRIDKARRHKKKIGFESKPFELDWSKVQKSVD